MNELLFPIPQDVLTATIEALRDLEGYYESDACALARLDSKQAKELAQERLESAGVASGLFTFYLGL
ncbi:hypothetical protein [Flavonifractor plautii]|uniref:hypothetical protein n=1 Tax=Flavonifractor plautii TaxID=292800 RepID=UPI00214AF01C|nr:hypothetical protein [Flavonifractor plautii]MCR1911012.1 hypothetical protein [Flavonifractor plautii]